MPFLYGSVAVLSCVLCVECFGLLSSVEDQCVTVYCECLDYLHTLAPSSELDLSSFPCSHRYSDSSAVI